MKTLFILLFIVTLNTNLFAVGNIVVKDIELLTKRGFSFSTIDYLSNKKTIAFTVIAPKDYDFSAEELYVKPFTNICYIKPEAGESGAGLIGAGGTRLFLAHTDEKKGKASFFAMLRKEANGGYRSFL